MNDGNRVVQVRRFGGPDGLEVAEAPLPTAGRGEVRVTTVSLHTKKIKGLHENDFIMASKIDRIFDRSVRAAVGTHS